MELIRRLVGEQIICFLPEQVEGRSSQSLQLRGIYDVLWWETKNESIYIFGVLRGSGARRKFSNCEGTNDQSNYANFLDASGGESQRASDGGKASKASSERTCGTAGRPSANRFEPSKV
jgi:hypothetical protein